MRLIESFEHSALSGVPWNELVAAGSTDVVFLTLEWQREWWRVFGGNRLLLVVAEDIGRPKAIAPMYALEDMLFLVGSGGSDYLDFIGDFDEETLAAMLDCARRELPAFAGIGLYHIPAASRTTALLPGVARRLGLDLDRGDEMIAPYLDLADDEHLMHITERPKWRREEARMQREGPLRTREATHEDLDRWLEAFFAQQIARWRPESDGEAFFEDERRRAFVRGVVQAGQPAGWVRFTMLEWRDKPAAFDLSLVRGARHLTYLVSRDPSIRRYSPGKLLYSYVIKRAHEEGALLYDFGLGDEDYKLSLATGAADVVNWSLWPS